MNAVNSNQYDEISYDEISDDEFSGDEISASPLKIVEKVSELHLKLVLLLFETCETL